MTAGPDIGRPAPLARPVARALLAPLLAALAGALLIALLAQIPASHPVDVGGYDVAYVQGFYDAERADDPGGPAAYLDGSDGAARWTRPSGSALLFPQAGLPGAVSLRLRAWRPDGPPPRVTVLLNGVTPLADIQADGGWQELTLPVRSGVLKASDFFVEIRAEPALTLPDGRAVGVLLDRAGYTTGAPALPYPAQLVYGGLVGGMLALLLRPPTTDHRPTIAGTSLPQWLAGRWSVVGGLLIYGLLWLLLYHSQPPLYPYPLRMLPPAICLGLAGLLALRHGPPIVARAPYLAAAVAPAAVIGIWLAATLLAARGHVTLARPGVENDFRVFATRETLDQVFSADGFYNLGYPLLLWLVRPLYGGNAFLAGRLLAALSGAAMLGGGYWLARALLPPGPALLALAALALSGLVAQYGLYVGSDMPFAACVVCSVAATVSLTTDGRRPTTSLCLAFFGGILGGLAFLMRHLGLVLLPWGVVVLLLSRWRRAGRWSVVGGRCSLAFALGFLLAAAPQIIINTAQAGSPLYNQQAKNIWLAVYGGTDWGRWDEAPNSVTLAQVILRDPGRFLANWWHNLVGYIGSGAEDTSEFGRADQLRLIGWPANWLAVGGLAWWLVAALRRPTTDDRRPMGAAGADSSVVGRWSLVALTGVYVAAVSTAFTLQRFFLPLAAIYAVAAGWAVWRALAPLSPGGRGARGEGTGRALLGVGLALVVVLWGGWAGGARYALSLQPADEVAAVQMVRANLPAGATLGARVSARLPLAKYSAIAHRVADWPAGADSSRPISAADLADLRAAGAGYLLWDEAAGPPPLADPAGARLASSGRYGLYRLETH